MSDNAKVRVGIVSARELELEVEDAEQVSAAVEGALSNGDGLFWITDSRGQRYGIVTEKLAFLQVEKAETRPGVGFSAKEAAKE